MNKLVESYIITDWARKMQFSNKPYYKIVNEHIKSYFDLTKEVNNESIFDKRIRYR
jgi:hypothetical protein